MDKDKASIVRVFVNDVEVGSVPTEQFLQIKKNARADIRLYLDQAINLFCVFTNFVYSAFLVVPYVLIFGLFLLLMFDSTTFQEMLEAFRSSSTAEITIFFKNLCSITITISVFVKSASIPFGHYFGFKNSFNNSVAKTLRQVLETPVEGKMFLRFDKAKE